MIMMYIYIIFIEYKYGFSSFGKLFSVYDPRSTKFCYFNVLFHPFYLMRNNDLKKIGTATGPLIKNYKSFDLEYFILFEVYVL